MGTVVAIEGGQGARASLRAYADLLKIVPKCTKTNKTPYFHTYTRKRKISGGELSDSIPGVEGAPLLPIHLGLGYATRCGGATDKNMWKWKFII